MTTTTGLDEDVFNYPMTRKPKRGSALILQMRKFDLIQFRRHERSWSDMDAANLAAQFQKRGIKSTISANKTRKQVEETLQKEAKRDHTGEEVFVCAILSYGDHGMVYATDKSMYVADLMEFFKPGKAHASLTQIPKVFIFQADQTDQYVFPNAAATDGGTSQTIPAEADFLQVWSLIPSWLKDGDDKKPLRFKNPESPESKEGRGSCFIDALVQVMESTDNMEFKKVVQNASRLVAWFLEKDHPGLLKQANYQIPYFISMLRGPIYLPKVPTS